VKIFQPQLGIQCYALQYRQDEITSVVTLLLSITSEVARQFFSPLLQHVCKVTYFNEITFQGNPSGSRRVYMKHKFFVARHKIWSDDTNGKASICVIRPRQFCVMQQNFVSSDTKIMFSVNRPLGNQVPFRRLLDNIGTLPKV
jgi:hypothetical protein